MTQPLETVYIEILPDFSNFAKSLKSDLNKALKTIRDQSKAAFEQVEDAAQDAGRTIDISIRIGVSRATDSIDDLADSARRDFNQISRAARDTGREIGQNFSGQTVSGFLGVIAQLGQALIGLGHTARSPAGLVVLVAAISAAAPVIIGVTAALADLVGFAAALPATFVVAAAALAPLIIAFQGFGDAISAFAGGDAKKINEALTKLAPAARSVAQEIGSLIPAFRTLQSRVQDAFFRPLQGVLSEIGRTLLPQLTAGLTTTAASLGRLAANFGRLLTAPNVIRLIEQAFASTGRILDRIGPSANLLFTTLTDVAIAGLPFVERLTSLFAGLADEFSAFSARSLETGDFQAFLEDALATLEQLLDLGRAVGSLLATIFGATDDAGRGFLATLTDLVQRFNQFLQSVEGQQALEGYTILVKAAGVALGGFVNGVIITLQVLAAINQALINAGLAISNYIDQLTEFVNSIPSLLQQLPDRITAALANLTPTLLSIFATAFGTAQSFVANSFNSILSFISSVPSRISELAPTFAEAGRNLIRSFTNGFRQVGTFIGDVAGDIVSNIKGFLNRAIDRINSGIATIDNLLPGSLSRIPRLAQGGIVPAQPGGRQVIVSEGGEDEAIIPLSKLDNLGTSGPTITFGPGSIVVNFEGVTPTAGEARTVGEGIGQGILSQLTRQGVRMQVRAI